MLAAKMRGMRGATWDGQSAHPLPHKQQEPKGKRGKEGYEGIARHQIALAESLHGGD